MDGSERSLPRVQEHDTSQQLYARSRASSESRSTATDQHHHPLAATPPHTAGPQLLTAPRRTTSASPRREPPAAPSTGAAAAVNGSVASFAAVEAGPTTLRARRTSQNVDDQPPQPRRSSSSSSTTSSSSSSSTSSSATRGRATTTPGGNPRVSTASRRSGRAYRVDEDVDAALLVYTRPIRPPGFLDVLRQFRFMMRTLQLAFTIAGFVSILVSALKVNYSATVDTVSGINLYTFTSLGAIFVGLSTMAVYVWPHYLECVPHRYHRISRVEVGFDLFFFGLWLSSATVLAWYGKCPKEQAGGDENASCTSWLLSMIFGFICAGLYFVSILYGLYDLYTHNWGFETYGTMFARGSWIQKQKKSKKSHKADVD